MESTKGKRKPRYRRVPETAFRVQKRDAEILHHIFQHRFLTSEHIRSLVDGSQQKILRRLQSLFHGGYLDRPKEQLSWWVNWAGSQPIVYGLGNKGADILEERFAIPRSKVDWTSKNREIKTYALKHTLGIAHFMVCLEKACERESYSSLIKIIKQEKIAQAIPEKAKNRYNPLSWKVEFKEGNRNISIGVLPDKIFGLHFPKLKTLTAGTPNTYFFLEIDRSTMPVERHNLSMSSIYRKMLAYYNAYLQNVGKGSYQGIFPFPSPRILFVTESLERMHHMIAVNKKIDRRGKGLGIFLFTTKDNVDIKEPERLLDNIWTDGCGNTVKLYKDEWISP